MSDIKESLRQLMAENNWTAEQVTKAIEKLQSCNSVFACLPILWQKLLACLIDYNVVERASCRQGDLRWIPVNEFSAEYPAISYRINLSFTIPDLEETEPRYESGTLLANTLNGGVVEVVGVDTWRGKPSNESSYRYVIKNSNGELCSISGNDERYQPLPPRHDLKEGWEYTGKAAKIDKATKLAEGERWVSIFGEIIDPPALPRQDFNQWRHIASKKKEEPKPVEYVDLSVEIESGYIVVIHPDYAGGVPIQLFLKDAKLIGFVFADGITRCDIRPLNPDGGPALIPTHVRMAKGAE